MRFQCEACHELVDGEIAVDGGAAIATCSKCAARTVVSGQVPKAVAASAAAPAPRSLKFTKSLCPKCGADRPPGGNCRTCGIAVDKMDAYASTRDAAVPAPLHAAWEAALESWGDPARHDALFRLVTSHSAYAWAAAMYRDAGKQRPDDDVSPKQLDRIRKGAELMMRSDAVPRPEKASSSYRATIMILVVLVAMVIALVLYELVVKMRTPDGGDEPPSAGQVR